MNNQEEWLSKVLYLLEILKGQKHVNIFIDNRDCFTKNIFHVKLPSGFECLSQNDIRELSGLEDQDSSPLLGSVTGK